MNISVNTSTSTSSLSTVSISDIVPFPIPWNTHAQLNPIGIATRKNDSILSISVIIGPRFALVSE